MIISENDLKAEPKQQFNITTRNSRNIWGLITNCKCSINGCKCFKLLDIPQFLLFQRSFSWLSCLLLFPRWGRVWWTPKEAFCCWGNGSCQSQQLHSKVRRALISHVQMLASGWRSNPQLFLPCSVSQTSVESPSAGSNIPECSPLSPSSPSSFTQFTPQQHPGH